MRLKAIWLIYSWMTNDDTALRFSHKSIHDKQLQTVSRFDVLRLETSFGFNGPVLSEFLIEKQQAVKFRVIRSTPVKPCFRVKIKLF